MQLAIDDFGTGYSSLSYLRRFPIDVLKIDRSFIGMMGNSAEGSALPRAIVALGRSLNLMTIAEGIETAEQLAELQGMACDFAQGYYFTKPLWTESMGALLSRKYMDIRPAQVNGLRQTFRPELSPKIHSQA